LTPVNLLLVTYTGKYLHEITMGRVKNVSKGSTIAAPHPVNGGRCPSHLRTVLSRPTDTYAECRIRVELGTTPTANISIPCMSASGRKRAVHGSPKKPRYPGRASKVIYRRPFWMVASNVIFKNPSRGERRVGRDFFALKFLRVVISF